MVSIALATHKVDANNVNTQWSAGQLSAFLNTQSLFSTNPNFYINSVALMRGFLLFRRDLTRRGMFVIEMFQEDRQVPAFHCFKHSRTSLDVKFLSYFTPSISEEEFLSSIVPIRNDLQKRNEFEVSAYSSPSLVFGVIQLSILQNQTAMVDVGTSTVDKTPAKLRKSPSNLTDRSIKNVTSKVITSVDEVVGEKNSFFFLKSAVKILDFKKRKHSVILQDEQDGRSEDDEEDNDSQECSEFESYMSDERLRTALDKLPSKNIVYSSDDMENILELYGIVKEVVYEKTSNRVSMKAAKLTIDMLDTNSNYSQLTARTFLRWYEMEDKESEKPGRKINEKFESEVWGMLMLCIFEKANEDVSVIACFISDKVTSVARMSTSKNANNRTERTYIFNVRTEKKLFEW